MARPYVSVLIPTYRPGPGIVRVLEKVAAQCVDVPFEVVIVDSSSSPDDVARMRSYPVRFQQIPSTEFGHGRTRNLLASLAIGDVLLFLSQDAEPASENWMSALLEPLHDERVAGTYARQIPRSNADPLMRFFLERTYGPQPAWRRLSGSTAVSIDDIFFSNVSSAIRRSVWQQHPFRDDIVMSEDQYWAYDVLTHGYDVVYVPDAQVYHSHNYTLPTLFNRNWQSGASLRGLIADSRSAIARRGAGYVLDQARFLVRDGRMNWVPYMLVYEATKAAGFSLGMRYGKQQRRRAVNTSVLIRDFAE
ncbi:MAG: glycosyltransferase family 2 protein [Chloroflexi bacterium]|nr:glycosyltransferase family 2 protein [Chloroflexota bacterium]